MNTSQNDAPLSFTERARRAQLIEVTVDLVSQHGYQGTSLAKIAEAAGITKAAVLYHYRSKAAVVRAAYNHVLNTLVQHVAAAVETSDPTEAPAAYIRSMISHLREHPHHARMLAEAATHEPLEHDPSVRWRALSGLLESAMRARGVSEPGEQRHAAIILGGAIDGIVAEQLSDPDYDTASAAEELIVMTEAWIGGPTGGGS